MEVKFVNGWTCNKCTAENMNFTDVCSRCKQRQSRGLGDTIHKITSALHIPHCGGCEERRQWLNNVLPYKQQ